MDVDTRGAVRASPVTERSALLSPSAMPRGATAARGAGGATKTRAAHLLTMAQLTWPAVLSTIGFYSLNFTALLFAGHVDDDALAATGLAIMIANVSGFALCWGLLTALE